MFLTLTIGFGGLQSQITYTPVVNTTGIQKFVVTKITGSQSLAKFFLDQPEIWKTLTSAQITEVQTSVGEAKRYELFSLFLLGKKEISYQGFKALVSKGVAQALIPV